MGIGVRRLQFDDFPLSYLSDGAFRYLFPSLFGGEGEGLCTPA